MSFVSYFPNSITSFVYHFPEPIYNPLVYWIARTSKSTIEKDTSDYISSGKGKFILFLIDDGELTVHLGSKEYDLNKEYGVFFELSEDFVVDNKTNSKINCKYIIFKGANVSLFYNKFIKNDINIFQLDDSFISVINDVFKICENSTLDKTKLSIDAYSLLLQLSESKSENKVKLTSDIYLYIEENYTNSELSIHDLSNYLHFSYHYFCHVFKDENGISPQKYLTKYRLEKALYLLRNTNNSIESISTSVGFKNKKVLINECSKLTGLLPNAYRKTTQSHLLKYKKHRGVTLTNISDIADPFIIYDDNKYYMFTGITAGNEIEVFTSDNLNTFQKVGAAINSESSFGENDFWSPEVIKYKDKFYMFYSAIGKDGYIHISVASSKKPEGPYSDLNKEKPLLNLDKIGTVDAHPFVDKDGVYLFFAYKYALNKNGQKYSKICAVKLNDDLNEVEGDIVDIISPTEEYENSQVDSTKRNDAPFVLKHDNKYYLTYSVCMFLDDNYSTILAVSDNLLGPYQKIGPILKSLDNTIVNPGHCSFFYDKKGVLKCCFHTKIVRSQRDIKRRACTANASFENNLLKIDIKSN